MTRRGNAEIAESVWGNMSQTAIDTLQDLTKRYSLRIASGDLLYLTGTWYITHAGLLRIAQRKHCAGILVRPAHRLCNPATSRWAFKATVYKSPHCKGFVGYGDADPSNVSPLVHGAEMRVAETRAVNRALRKAYGIGICSVEEIGPDTRSAEPAKNAKKHPSKSVNGNGWKAEPKRRDRLC